MHYIMGPITIANTLMELSIASARVVCLCNGENAKSYHTMNNMRFCDKCLVKRCLYCTLHTVKEKMCSRCGRHYDSDTTHCLRCYECPLCGTSLSSYPVPYTLENGVMKVAREKDAKIVGKAVFFKCKQIGCTFRFSTHVETRPQTLQDIVQGSVKDFGSVRYNELLEYYEWCANYHRIQDKRQRTKWMSEMIKRYGDLELTNEEDSIATLENKEKNIVLREGNTRKKTMPVAKKLNCTMSDVCITCLGETKSLVKYAPVVYVETIQEKQLVSFLNKSGTNMHVTVLEEGYEFNISPCGGTLKSVPTCLLGYVEGTNDWKKEVDVRDITIFDSCEGGLIEVGDGWVTINLNNKERVNVLVESTCIEYII